MKNLKNSNALHLNRRQGDKEEDDDATDTNAAELNLSSSSSPTQRRIALEKQFAQHRLSEDNMSMASLLKDWMAAVDEEIRHNVHGGIRWIRPYLLPSLADGFGGAGGGHRKGKQGSDLYFVRNRNSQRFAWQDEYDALLKKHGGTLPGPPVDYTDPNKYQYPSLMSAPPEKGGYPKMTPLGDLMRAWDQDEDYQGIITENLMHFDFTNPEELSMAEKFRDAMVPFKLTNVPELLEAGQLWTDEYVAEAFAGSPIGLAQESPNHFFAWFAKPKWNEDSMGLPPSRNNDWDYATWAKHARYADAAALAADQPHFYWQAGVTPDERYQPESEWSFISRALPSWSATEPNFIMFHPENQKGIQCRFGERGVTAATHYDAGRNMVAMISGAKRYILSPPTACGKLGMFKDKSSPIYRHSLLNFGHIKYLDNDNLGKDMSSEERQWLERASTAPTVETVLKAGEVLYIPCGWFHYIVSIQKSAQCNARSGVEVARHPEFGGYEDVQQCKVE